MYWTEPLVPLRLLLLLLLQLLLLLILYTTTTTTTVAADTCWYYILLLLLLLLLLLRILYTITTTTTTTTTTTIGKGRDWIRPIPTRSGSNILELNCLNTPLQDIQKGHLEWSLRFLSEFMGHSWTRVESDTASHFFNELYAFKSALLPIYSLFSPRMWGKKTAKWSRVRAGNGRVHESVKTGLCIEVRYVLVKSHGDESKWLRRSKLLPRDTSDKEFWGDLVTSNVLQTIQST